MHTNPVMYGRIEYPLARRGTMIKPLLQLLVAILVLSLRESKGRYEWISRNLLTNAVANAIVVGGVLLPHGDFALDPSFFPNGTQEREAADRVARGARRAGRWLTDLQQQQQQHRFEEETIYGDSYVADEDPMIVLLMTPHGIKLDNDYGIYISSKGSGTATIGGDCTGSKGTVGHFGSGGLRHHREPSQEMSTAMKDGRHHCQHKPYNVTINNMDLAPTTLAKDLLTVLRQDKGHPVSGVYSYNDETAIPLNWGEIVPLLLLPTTYASATSSSVSPSTKNPQQLLPLIWTFPYRRYNHSVDMVPELLQVGADTMEWAQQRPERIAIIVSGDLSHTHQSSGPYGYSDASAPYDAAIGLWAGGQTNGTTADVHRDWDPCQPEATNALLHRAKELQPDAKSCGFTGYVMWHGMMCSSSPTAPLWTARDDSAKTDNGIKNKSDRRIIHRNDRRVKFDSKVFVNRNVTYYGMIGATFEPYLAGEEGNNDVGKRMDFNNGKEDN